MIVVPESVFLGFVWLSLLGVFAGSLYLASILIREWRKKMLW